MVEGDGFEPSKAQLTDLQSAPFGHSGIPRHMERMMRIELTPSAWKAEVLPLNYIRMSDTTMIIKLELVEGIEPPTC